MCFCKVCLVSLALLYWEKYGIDRNWLNYSGLNSDHVGLESFNKWAINGSYTTGISWSNITDIHPIVDTECRIGCAVIPRVTCSVDQYFGSTSDKIFWLAGLDFNHSEVIFFSEVTQTKIVSPFKFCYPLIWLTFVYFFNSLKLHRVFSPYFVIPTSSGKGPFHCLNVRGSKTLEWPFIQVLI